jgi:integrase
VKAARQGRDLLAEESKARQAEDERLTVEKLIERYAKAIASPNRKDGPLRTAPEIESRLRRALASKLPTAADDLTRSDISDLLDPVFDNHPREAEKRRQVIGSMYRWGIAKGYVSIDPTAGSEAYGRGNPGDRVLSPDEIGLFWAWLTNGAAEMPLDCIEALKLQLCTGARIGETAGIDAEEIRTEGERLVWHLPRSRSKNKQERTTPLVGRARSIVEAALSKRKRGPLFKTALTERKLTSADVGHALKVRKLPCPHFTSHDLRRTVVSAMDELGIALDTIAAAVGHQRGSRDTRTLVRHYSRPKLDARVEAALLTWDNRLSEIIEGSLEQNADNIVKFRVAP